MLWNMCPPGTMRACYHLETFQRVQRVQRQAPCRLQRACSESGLFAFAGSASRKSMQWENGGSPLIASRYGVIHVRAISACRVRAQVAACSVAGWNAQSRSY
jgi:hypothetical protein